VPNVTNLLGFELDYTKMSVRFFPCFSLASLICPAIFLFAPAMPAATPPLPPQCAPAATAEFLNTRLAFWQQRLNLGDWKLSVVSSHPGDLKPQTLGNVHWDTDKKTAVIRVLSPSDYQMSCPAALDDMELTVVHELVHLTLVHLRNANTDRNDEERAVVQLTDALLKLDRTGRQHAPAPATVAAHTPTACSNLKTEACRADHR
jgi:hypothetical protein